MAPRTSTVPPRCHTFRPGAIGYKPPKLTAMCNISCLSEGYHSPLQRTHNVEMRQMRAPCVYRKTKKGYAEIRSLRTTSLYSCTCVTQSESRKFLISQISWNGSSPLRDTSASMDNQQSLDAQLPQLSNSMSSGRATTNHRQQ